MSLRKLLPVTLLILTACHHNEPVPAHDILADNIDTTISAATDFFDYANGAWIKKNPVPSDQGAWGIGYLVQLDTYNRLRAINEKSAAENSPGGSVQQKIGDFWYSGMDSSGIEKAGLQPIQPDLTKINNVKTLSDFLQVTAAFGNKGVDALMGISISQDEKKSDEMALHIWQGGLGMPDRDYYFNNDEKSLQVRKAYQIYIYKSFRLLGADSAQATHDANEVYFLESRLARASRKLQNLRDPDSNYYKISLADLQKKYDQLSWSEFFKNSDIHSLPDSLILGQPEFLHALGNELLKTPLSVWKNYLSFHYLHSAAPYLNDSVYYNRFNYSRTLSGVEKPRVRWKRVLDAEENAMGEALGQLFVKEYFPEKAKQRYTDLVEAIRDAYKERILALKWMSDSTKKKAIFKLSKISKKVGYPDKWKDYSALQIDKGPWILNVQRANEWKSLQEIKKLGKPVDRTEWDMSPQTYNAYYNPSNNEIVLPAGMFSVPGKKDDELDDAFVYGYAAASTIGHEITHGFDDQGRKFDEAGNLRDWWLPQDSKLFTESAGGIIKEFNAFIPVDSLHINGTATQGENIADLGGLVIGWDAFTKTEAYKKGEKISGFSPAQRFFLGYAYSWMYNERKEGIASQLMTDVHAPAKERVNGPLANIPAFYEAFGVKPGDKMYRPDSLRVVIW